MSPAAIIRGVIGIILGIAIGSSSMAVSMYEHLNKTFKPPEEKGVPFPSVATGGAVYRGNVDMHGTVYVCLPNQKRRGGVKTYGYCDGVNAQYVVLWDAVPQNKKLVRFKMHPVDSRGMADVQMYWK